MTNFNELFSALGAPFDPREVRVRTESEGRQLHYITARTAMNRLDNVVGPENWWDEYAPGLNSVICRLTVRLPDGSTVTKSDAGGYAKMGDSGDDDKSGFSDSFKRAAVKFGVGRYLYRDGVPDFVSRKEMTAEEVIPSASNVSPAHAQVPTHAPSGVAVKAQPQVRSTSTRNSDAPRTGRALFAWSKKQEEEHKIDLVKHLNRWAKFQEIGERMIDWSPEEVALGYEEATRKIDAALRGRSEAYEEALAN